ncbi:GNAT family N-acetyltransferase [Candidatus Uhrbacteria bacterium]|nr:GNAT family N-acetyltransferase [Candidatus Uhrbacteria bacterium]
MAFDPERFVHSKAQLWDYRDCITFLNEHGQDLLRSGPLDYKDALFQARLMDPNRTRISIIREKGARQIVAVALLKISYDWRKGVGDVEYVLVHPEFRGEGRGLGRAVMEHLIEQAGEVRPKISLLKLVSEEEREGARILYEKLGFRPVKGSNIHFEHTLS